MTQVANTQQVNMRLNSDLVELIDEEARRRRTSRTGLVETFCIQGLGIDPDELRETIEEADSANDG